jgi:hypothetical protein
MAEEKKKWDLTKTHSMAAAAEWLRKRGDCILVVAIRANDVAFSADPRCTPLDAVELVRVELPRLLQQLEMDRVREKAKGEGR